MIEKSADELRQLVAAALGHEGAKPNPWPLQAYLTAWGYHFQRVRTGADGKTVQARPPCVDDFPAEIQHFFRELAKVSGRGRPCRGEEYLKDALNAWKQATGVDDLEIVALYSEVQLGAVFLESMQLVGNVATLEAVRIRQTSAWRLIPKPESAGDDWEPFETFNNWLHPNRRKKRSSK